MQPLADYYAPSASTTHVHNALIDQVMPALSGFALKILLVVLRATWGYADPSSPTGRRQCDRLSYSQFRRRSEIKTNATVSRALQKCGRLSWVSTHAPPGHPRSVGRGTATLFAANENPALLPAWIADRVGDGRFQVLHNAGRSVRVALTW